jgi:hypothetical protein
VAALEVGGHVQAAVQAAGLSSASVALGQRRLAWQVLEGLIPPSISNSVLTF